MERADFTNRKEASHIYLWAIITVHLRYKNLLKTTTKRTTGNVIRLNKELPLNLLNGVCLAVHILHNVGFINVFLK